MKRTSLIKIVSAFLTLAFSVQSCKKDNIETPLRYGAPGNDTNKSKLTPEMVRGWLDSVSSARVKKIDQIGGSAFNLNKLALDWKALQISGADQGGYLLGMLNGRAKFNNLPQGYRKIFFYRDSESKIQANILEFIPDVLYFQKNRVVKTADYTGRIFVFDRDYHLLGGKIFAGGKQIGEIKAKENLVRTDAPVTDALHTNLAQVVQTCVWQDSGYFDGEGVWTIYSEQICSTTIIGGSGSTGDSMPGGFTPGTGDYAGSGGGSGAGDSPPTSPPDFSNLPGETSPGIDPKSYMTCFGNIPDAGATMNITVYVQEPFPGTTFNFGANSVGHVAIGLSKSSGSATVNQVVGFYPDASGYSKMHAPSKINNNGGDLEYNVSITYSVNADQFNRIVNYIANPPGQYDLMEFNCTNFVIGACNAGSVTLPNAVNTVGIGGPGGYATAMTPAGLGNSIENLKGQNGVNTSGGITPNSKGACN